MIKTTASFLAVLTLVACGGATPAATDPASQTTVTSTPESATPATPATPAVATPATPAMPATPAVATPTAPTAPATPAATPATTPETPAKAEPCVAAKEVTSKDLASCKTTCAKLDDKAPAGSKCIPARTACLSNCDTKFKK